MNVSDEESAVAAASPASPEQRISNVTSSTSPTSPNSAGRVPSFRNSVDQHVQPRALRSSRYSRRRQDEVPAILKYFRRESRQQDSAGGPDMTPENTYFLPSSPIGLRQVRRPISNAVSNSSVVYSEINEASNVPAAYCCIEHATLVRQKSYTPPPSYVDCMM